ncbi:MAG: DUF3237 domain-containing protein [Aestuariivita sp.]|uniref:DUF3237 domain-containing protein n=1 Tax=Aestuariivita sp. TaxID=1872407 RepID=UPI003BAFF11F
MPNGEIPELSSQLLFEMTLQVAPATAFGATPSGKRFIAYVTEGHFEGPHLKGRVLPGGGDWVIQRPDHVFQLDVRITLETDDGALIYSTYRGARHGSRDVMRRIAAGQPVQADEYYFRTTPYFETASEKYSWLGGIVSVGIGRDRPGGVTYRVHQIL